MNLNAAVVCLKFLLADFGASKKINVLNYYANKTRCKNQIFRGRTKMSPHYFSSNPFIFWCQRLNPEPQYFEKASKDVQCFMLHKQDLNR